MQQIVAKTSTTPALYNLCSADGDGKFNAFQRHYQQRTGSGLDQTAGPPTCNPVNAQFTTNRFFTLQPGNALLKGSVWRVRGACGMRSWCNLVH